MIDPTVKLVKKGKTIINHIIIKLKGITNILSINRSPVGVKASDYHLKFVNWKNIYIITFFSLKRILCQFCIFLKYIQRGKNIKLIKYYVNVIMCYKINPVFQSLFSNSQREATDTEIKLKVIASINYSSVSLVISL